MEGTQNTSQEATITIAGLPFVMFNWRQPECAHWVLDLRHSLICRPVCKVKFRAKSTSWTDLIFKINSFQIKIQVSSLSGDLERQYLGDLSLIIWPLWTIKQ